VKEDLMLARSSLVVLLLSALPAIAQPDQKVVTPGPATRPAKTQAELEKWFTDTMSNATLAGSFSVKGSDAAPKPDKYKLGDVTHKEGDQWIITASMTFAGREINVPIELPVKWAGDTPVITVDNVGIPGHGTYNARVLIFGDEYVGVWSNTAGTHGGEMWGKITHEK
jgi:hypothetical protein